LDAAGILFDRPINPRKWPKKYEKVFGVIRDIGRQCPQEYSQAREFDILPLRDKQARVVQLIMSAQKCLTAFKNEADWRAETEEQVMARFDSEVVW
jgi:hypothetical protein